MVMTIIKILISVPTAMLLASKDVSGAALMGGHLDNKNSTTIDKSLLTDYELYDDQELGGNFTVSYKISTFFSTKQMMHF